MDRSTAHSFRLPVESGGPVAEAYRSLRASLAKTLAQGRRSICLVSCWPGDGKSMVATNLAASLCQLHLKVLLVDGDLRRPTLSRVFGVTTQPGFSNALEQSGTATQHVATTSVEGLSLLPSGTSGQNPANLLGKACLHDTLLSVQSQVDCVIVDTPPLSACSDALLIAAHCDTSLFVVTPKGWDGDVEARYKQQMVDQGIHISGVILNAADERERSGYGYGYGYGKGYGSYGHYGQEQEVKKKKRWGWF